MFSLFLLVGYTMKDIRYWWLEGAKSVGMSSDVELPQFKVIGHRQRSKEVPLTTGKIPLFSILRRFHEGMFYIDTRNNRVKMTQYDFYKSTLVERKLFLKIR
ncbi:hypothetical protein AVEN_1496-1 [Araneus ventricosus]|uniref:Uncharacterized protein n=1 Tax=Araneus ventricosus TaxID=182803 RepID=A0A4Y2MH64_ARAVE|nr:hypothetical protein AVEN_1496-1 [Araneus ventricosus]